MHDRNTYCAMMVCARVCPSSMFMSMSICQAAQGSMFFVYDVRIYQSFHWFTSFHIFHIESSLSTEFHANKFAAAVVFDTHLAGCIFLFRLLWPLFYSNTTILHSINCFGEWSCWRVVPGVCCFQNVLLCRWMEKCCSTIFFVFFWFLLFAQPNNKCFSM